MASLGDYEPVIGLEVHAQLLTRTKAFCACETSFGDPPNTHTCPVCLGLPGALPVLNVEVVRMAVSAALALGCTIQRQSIFARKNYFYPDLPKGYQISQYEIPIAVKGGLEIEVSGEKRRIGIYRLHIEEDAGKNVHGGDQSVVDLNRAGTPLIEIVGDPELRSGVEAAEYLKRLREVLMFIGVNDGNLEQGSFRCDANVSVRKIGDTKLGTRTELKNINSFKFVAEAIDVEARRQVTLLERGERIRQQTRGYNSDKRETYTLRDKENEAGYRYFPEPDLPPLSVSDAYLAAVQKALPATPAQRRRALVESRGVAPATAGVITSHPRIADFYGEVLNGYGDAVKAANFVVSEVLRDVKTSGLGATFPVSAAQVTELLRLVDEGAISGKQAKEVYGAIAGTTRSPADVVREKGMAVMSNEGELETIARALIDANAKQATAYRGGKTALLGFFVGQMMKQTGGSGNPAMVNAVLKRLLDGTEATPEGHEKPAVHEMKTRVPDSDPAPTPPTAAASGPAASTPDATPTSIPRPQAIPYEAFEKLDIRVGVVVTAARIPRKDKLLDLTVDTGDESGPRRIVAGLALSFTPEELVGKRVLVLCNLEARAFSKDLISHGMILASGPSEALALTTVSRDVPPGTRVK